MATPQLFDIYPAIFDSLTLNQLDSVDPSPGVENLIAMAGGQVDPALEAIATADPRIKFSSRDVQAILTGCNVMTGKNITSSGKVQYQRRADGGVYAGSGNHVSLTSSKGFLFIEEFGADQGSKEGADINAQFVALYDGTNAPIVCNVGQNLSGTPAVNAVHALGPVVLEGAQLPGVTKVRVKTGIEVMVKPADGEITSRICVIIKRAPMIEIELLNLTFINSLGFFKKEITSGVTCYFQKVYHGRDRVAFGTAEHLSASITQGTYSVTGITGSKSENASAKLTIMATNNNISVSAATAISLP